MHERVADRWEWIEQARSKYMEVEAILPCPLGDVPKWNEASETIDG